MKILVATDGSKNALRAVKYAARLAHLLRTASDTITLISVHDDTGLRHAKAFVGQAEVADDLRELSEKELKPARKLLQADGIGYDMESTHGPRGAGNRRLRQQRQVRHDRAGLEGPQCSGRSVDGLRGATRARDREAAGCAGEVTCRR